MSSIFSQLIDQLLIIKISAIQVYLLWFLLGSFTVATLSDLKYLSAQREFIEIWIIFTIAMLGTDIYYHYYLSANLVYLGIKWGIILIFLPIYFHYIQKVARGDVWAKMSACSLLPPFFIIVFIALIGIIDYLTKKIWMRFGRARAYPFMPVIFFTTILLMIIANHISKT
ncbi:hypothetical protein ISS06_00075 [Patescibacteria group bacterium]|nr:hypothetical protein [Patescibacteria group bacterium]